MKIKTKDFKQSFSVVDTIPTIKDLPCSQFVRLRATEKELLLALTSTACAEARVSVEEGEKKEFWADRRALSAFLGSCPTDDIVLKTGNVLEMISGRCRITLSAVDKVSGYGAWEGKGKPVSLPEGWTSEIGALSSYISPSPSLEHLAAVQVVPAYGALVTDSFLLAAVLDKSLKTSPLIVPGELARLLQNLEGDLVVDENGAAIRSTAGYVYQTLTARLEKYPLKRILALADAGLKSERRLEFEAEAMLEGVRFLGRFTFGVEGDALIGVTTTEGGKWAETSLVGTGVSASRKVPATVKKAATVRWPLGKMETWLGHLVSVKADAVVRHGIFENCQSFSASAEGRTYLLVLANTE